MRDREHGAHYLGVELWMWGLFAYVALLAAAVLGLTWWAERPAEPKGGHARAERREDGWYGKEG